MEIRKRNTKRLIKWQRKNKVLIFGGNGFLGSHVVDELIRKKYSVTIFDLKKIG